MVFETHSWKYPLAVSAEVAAEELKKIADENGGQLEPRMLVDASRAEDAPLHSLFEWDDTVAAEKYRETQARFIIRNIVVKTEEAPPVRMMVHAGNPGYVQTKTALRDVDMHAALMRQAINDIQAFKAKYRGLRELDEVLREMDKAELAYIEKEA